MRVAVLGGGSWGTALAAHLARQGHSVALWLIEEHLAAEINTRHTNSTFLPGLPLPPALRATTDMASVAGAAELVLAAVPSQFCRGVYRRLRSVIPDGTVIVSATKGLEIESLKRMTEVAREELPSHPAAVLSGPSFALEVAQEQPTAVVAAAEDLRVAEALQPIFSSAALRVYATDDVIGVELGGALKNVIAIAAGIVTGLGYGHNTVAALITRGLAEISRLSVALGGRAETLAGLAGLGDLVLTCTGGLSRNRRVGQGLGAGKPLDEALDEKGMVAEGVRTTLAACALAQRARIEMPIAEQMRAVLYEKRPPRAAVEALMLRSLKRE